LIRAGAESHPRRVLMLRHHQLLGRPDRPAALALRGHSAARRVRGPAFPDDVSLSTILALKARRAGPGVSSQLEHPERAWRYLGERFLSRGLWLTYDDILDVCSAAWNALLAGTSPDPSERGTVSTSLGVAMPTIRQAQVAAPSAGAAALHPSAVLAHR
jgi:hypothetical protein